MLLGRRTGDVVLGGLNCRTTPGLPAFSDLFFSVDDLLHRHARRAKAEIEPRTGAHTGRGDISPPRACTPNQSFSVMTVSKTRGRAASAMGFIISIERVRAFFLPIADPRGG